MSPCLNPPATWEPIPPQLQPIMDCTPSSGAMVIADRKPIPEILELFVAGHIELVFLTPHTDPADPACRYWWRITPPASEA